MKIALLLLFFILCVLTSRNGASLGEDYEGYEDELIVDETGEIIGDDDRSNESSQSFTAMFTNTLEDETLQLFWVSAQGENVFIADIPATTSIPVTTYASHIFTAKPTQNKALSLSPRVHTMRANQNEYSFIGLSGGSVDTNIDAANSNSKNGKSSSSAHLFSPQTERPYYRVLNSPSQSCSAKFRNVIPVKVDVWYDDGREGVPQGTLDLGMEYTVNSYAGHVFYFTEHKQKHKVLVRHTVSPDQVLYIIEDKNRPPPLAMRDHIAREENFMSQYLQKHGKQWRHYFGPDGQPRGPPSQHMWAAEFVGQTHQVPISEHYWTCRGEESVCHTSPSNAIDSHSNYSINTNENNGFHLNLTVISTEPRAFFIEKFLSDVEVDAIIETAAPKMAGSFVGNKDGGGARKSDTRTSRNAWVSRASNEITETLFRRAEQLLKIPKLDHTNTEDMQVVHYVHGQKYDAHHDWGVSGYPESRYVTLLLYLTDMAAPDAGGETSFPKGANGQGFKIHPGKGNAILFYNLLPDGNGDDLSLHAALPVIKGEKWLANFWVWDPKRK